jgi:WD40 repeat protein
LIARSVESDLPKLRRSDTPTDGRAALSPDGKWLAIENSVEVATDLEVGYCELKLWDTAMGRLARTLEGSKWGALTPVFSHDGRLLALGNRNYETRLFDVATGKLQHTLPRKMTHELVLPQLLQVASLLGPPQCSFGLRGSDLLLVECLFGHSSRVLDLRALGADGEDSQPKHASSAQEQHAEQDDNDQNGHATLTSFVAS